MNTATDSFDYRKNALDLVRWIAAFEVMVLHFTGYALLARTGANPGSPQPFLLLLLRRITEGLPPVVVFFAVSGFLAAASMERSSRAQFLRRRFLRIYPALWVCVAVYALMMAAELKGRLDSGFPLWIAVSLTGAAYTPGCLAGFGTGSVNGALWMTGVLVQFYLLTAFLGGWLSHRPSRSRAAMLILFAAVNILFGKVAGLPGTEGPAAKLVSRTFLPYAAYFFGGAALYYDRGRILPRLRRYAAPLGAALIVWRVFVTVSGFAEPGYYAGIVTAVLSVLFAFAAAYALPAARAGFDVTYELYLMHWLALNYFVEFRWIAMYFWGIPLILFLLSSFILAWGLNTVTRRILLSLGIRKR